MQIRKEDISLPLLGKITVFATDKGVCAISLSNGEKEEQELFRSWGPTLRLTRAEIRDFPVREELTEYTEGRRDTFSIPLDLLTGTAFKREVWQILQAIPYGRCVSYQWVASKVGRPKAARAVGNAVGDNPIPILIPCHRVIRKDGRLGGFSSGIEKKRILLRIEGCEKEIKEVRRG